MLYEVITGLIVFDEIYTADCRFVCDFGSILWVQTHFWLYDSSHMGAVCCSDQFPDSFNSKFWPFEWDNLLWKLYVK